MSKPIVVPVYDFIGPLCVSTEDGEKLYEKIVPLLVLETPVVLSFENVEIIISAFLNASVGCLYGELPEETIRKFLSVEGMQEDDLDMLEQVVDNAKKYFSKPHDYNRAWTEEIGPEDEEPDVS